MNSAWEDFLDYIIQTAKSELETWADVTTSSQGMLRVQVKRAWPVDNATAPRRNVTRETVSRGLVRAVRSIDVAYTPSWFPQKVRDANEHLDTSLLEENECSWIVQLGLFNEVRYR